MKNLYKILSFLLVACLVACIPIVGFADRASSSYTVRIYGGDQGGFGTALNKTPIQTSVNYNGTVSINPFSGTTQVSLKDSSKYDIIGLREAGKGTGNYETIYAVSDGSGNITINNITHDADYVVAYGIASAVTTYTVQYLEQGTNNNLVNQVTRNEGETVADITTYRGITGARIIVAPRYIEGYSPVYSAGTVKTLSKDASENVFPIYYTRNATGTTTGGTTVVATGGGGVVAAGNGNANANTATANANANSVNPQPGYTPTEDILDLDVPLAEFEGPAASVAPVLVPFADVNGDTAQRKIPTGLTIALIVLLAGLIAALYWYLLFYRKKKKYANEVDYDFSFLDDDDHDDYR